MREKRIALAVCLVLLLISSVWLIRFPVPASALDSQVLTVKKAEKLMKSLTPVEGEKRLLTGLYFADGELPCDVESRTWYIPVDMDNSAWESGSFTGSDGVELYLLDNPLLDDKQEAVKTGKAYRLLAVKGGNYEIVQVVFSGLPMISLTTDSGEEIRYDEIYGTMRFYAADTKKNWVTESVMSAHIRGGSSRLNPKKSYKMTLYRQNQTGAGTLRKNKLSFLGMRTDDEWLLYAMYSEDSKVRDKLSQDIWNESGALGIESTGFYGYHMEYIEVFQNGEYRGIYGLMEPVDYKQLGLTKENGKNPEEYLYKQKDPEVYELKGNHSADDEAHREVLDTYLAYLGADDETFAAHIGELIDVDNALDVWLYLQAVIGMDNIQRNIFYPAVYADDRYQIRFMPWDMDYTWGNVHDFDAGNRTRFSEDILTMRIAWKIGDRLVKLDVDDARAKVTARWKELRESVYSDGWLCEHIDTYAHSVVDSGAFERDQAIWENGGHNSDYESLKELACDRMAFLDEQMADPLSYLDLEEYVE